MRFRRRHHHPVEPRARILYHYASPTAVREALTAGRLPTGELGPDGPTVAHYTWLTDDRNAKSSTARALSGSADDTLRVVLAVEDAVRWPVAAERDHVSRRDRDRVRKACPDAAQWLWVVDRPVPVEQWWVVQRSRDDRQVWPARQPAPSPRR